MVGFAVVIHFTSFRDNSGKSTKGDVVFEAQCSEIYW